MGEIRFVGTETRGYPYPVCKKILSCPFAHGLRQLTRDAKSDVSCLQTSLTRQNEKLRMTFGAGRQTT